LPDFFGLCPSYQKHFPEKLSKIVVDGGGGGGGLRKIPIREHISHKIDRISHKIDIICAIYFYNKPILPDCEANISRLALFAHINLVVNLFSISAIVLKSINATLIPILSTEIKFD
jgi:hypothetical protein